MLQNIEKMPITLLSRVAPALQKGSDRPQNGAGAMKSYVTVDQLAAGAESLHRVGLDQDARDHQAGTVRLGISALLYVPACLLTVLLLTPPVQAFFAAGGQRWLYIASTAFGLSFSLTPLAGFLARRLRMLDLPDARKLHARATPLLGGAAVFVGFITSLLANAILAPELIALLSAAMILFVAGVFDDWREVPAGLKLLIQLVCTAMVMISGIVLRILPADWGAWGWIGNLLLTGIWIIGITNAMNFFDGMDGLAAGLGAIIAFFLGVVAFQTNQPFLGWISLAVLGSCLGFLPYNFRPGGSAVIFLGDAGSTVIGFVLACIAVYGDWAEGQPIVSLVSPVLIFWLLIFDMAHITCDRILTGKVRSFREWIEYVGKDHLHHRLADVLGSRRKAVLFIYLMGLCLGLSALVLRDSGMVDAMLLILQAAILVVLITVLERRGRTIGAAGREDAARPAGAVSEPPGAAAGWEAENHRPAAQRGWPGAVPSAGG
jgi:UDP-GlcNAc:undecaprenyl-phosphate GlcNAc-1-phosphate transferase